MGGLGEVFGTVNKFFQKFLSYFNPIGRLYIQIQILCRVLVVQVFLDDLFGDTSLTCETQQIGCELNCVNRFAPITHQQLWSFELFMVLLSSTIFVSFNRLNEHMFHKKQKYEKTYGKQISDMKFRSARFQEKELDNGSTIKKSNYITVGYILMLVIRLVLEIFCICLEYTLAKHLSQNAKPSEVFQLKENWICSTNGVVNSEAQQMSIDLLLPPANRSELFYRTDENVACRQQAVTVTCWIPFSRMKSLGLIFMMVVICLQTILTFCELAVELIKPCVGENRGFSGSNKNNKNTLDRFPSLAYDKVVRSEKEENKGESGCGATILRLCCGQQPTTDFFLAKDKEEPRQNSIETLEKISPISSEVSFSMKLKQRPFPVTS